MSDLFAKTVAERCDNFEEPHRAASTAWIMLCGRRIFTRETKLLGTERSGFLIDTFVDSRRKSGFQDAGLVNKVSIKNTHLSEPPGSWTSWPHDQSKFGNRNIPM